MSNSPILHKTSSAGPRSESSTVTPTSPKSSSRERLYTPRNTPEHPALRRPLRTPEALCRPEAEVGKRRRRSRKRCVRKSATPPKFRKRTRASSYSPSSTEEYSDEDDFPSYRSDWKKKSPISTRELKNRIADIQNIIEEAQLKLKVLLSD
jgi:hypothetical protein